MPSVAVLGGGVAGLTAAHELACRGFDVTVYETRDGGVRGLGGKARSQYTQFKVGNQTHELPGEHGYRFFPAFYEMVPDVMSRIPTGDLPNPDGISLTSPKFLDPAELAGETVRHRLRSGDAMAFARVNTRLDRIARSYIGVQDYPSMFRALRKTIFSAITTRDFAKIIPKLVRYMVTGTEERLERYERLSFWHFMEADTLSLAAQRVLQFTPKSLVAMRATEGNTRTLLDLFSLMMMEFGLDRPCDFILNGPTTESWITPWARWLKHLGVTFVQGDAGRVVSLSKDGNRIKRATMANGSDVHADYFVLALPLEAAAKVVSEDLAENCQELQRVRNINQQTALGWMVGAQIFLRDDVPMVDGHVAFTDSPWAVTGVSQRQFWDDEYVNRLEAAGVGGVLSVIASEWTGNTVGVPQAAAEPREGILEELLRQVGSCSTRNGDPLLVKDNVLHMHLDDDLRFGANGLPAQNVSPLLIHPPGLWHQRPMAHTRLSNLVLASDYVRNPMDLATMEGACSAARSAVNQILAAAGVGATHYCRIQEDYIGANSLPIFRKARKRSDELFAAAPPGAGWLQSAPPPPVPDVLSEEDSLDYVLKDAASVIDPLVP